MGLFDVFKKKEKKVDNVFSPQVVKTSNVSHSLQEISKKYNIGISSLDFDILEVDTYVKLSKDNDFVLIDEQTIELIEQKNLLLDEHVEIKQSYEIKVKKFRFEDNFELVGKMVVDKELTHAKYLVSPSSLLVYDELLELKLFDELKKKKLRSGMLIDFPLFEPNFHDDVKKLIAKIRIIGSIEEDFEIELCKALPPLKPIKLKVIEHYKNHKKKDDRVKDFIYPIKKDMTIIEIVKPKPGRDGRSCRGKFIKVSSLQDAEIPTYSIDEAVIKKEDEDRVLYIANKNGYVYLEGGNSIVIKDELEVNQISLKTGNITGAEDSDVKLEVKESGALKEAIKDGMIVETTELVVKGNVGNNARIKAKKLEIDGQTHKESKIIAQTAQINAHKGYLKANNAVINRLEGGVVEAKSVHIKQAISGKVIAREIKIELLGSHVTLISSDLIEINKLKGSENKFIIDEAVVEHKEEYIESLEEKKEKLNIKIRQYKEKIKDNKTIILRNQKTIEQIKEKIKENKQNNIPVNPTFIQKVKKFNDFVKKTKELEVELKNLIAKRDKILEELEKIQNGVFLAKIISHNGFNEFNRIEFHLTEPPIKLTYDTKDVDKVKNIFVLKDFGDMEYKIVGEKE